MGKKSAKWCAKCREVHQDDCPHKVPWQRTKQTKGKSTTERGYGWKWQKQRKRIIERDNGLCQPCLAQGIITAFKEIDHITPKAKGGGDDDENLQCICEPCHKAKTAKEDSK